MPVTDHIRNKLSQVSHKPGVYLMKDRFGTVIYVGKARDLRKRVTTYFHPSRRMGWDLKFNALVEAIHDLDTHVVRNEAEALLLESKLIKEFHPRYNVSFRDDKRFLMLKVNLNDPIPRFTLTRQRLDDAARYFGPFANGGALRRTLHLVRAKFNLRGCRPLTPTQADYKHCLYAHLKVCTAPCIGNVTRDQYLLQVTAAADFLDGHCLEMAAELTAEMRKAAAALDFEKAAQLRDLLSDLQKTTEKTEKFERVPYKLPVSLNPEADVRELARVLGLAQAPERIEGFDISNISGTFAVASLVSFWHGRPDRANYRRFKMKSVVGQDDFACMAETVRRRYTRVLREMREAGGETSVGAMTMAAAAGNQIGSALAAAVPGEPSAPAFPRPAEEPNPNSETERSPAVAQVSKPAVSPTSKSAARRPAQVPGEFPTDAGLETCDTAGLEACATDASRELASELVMQASWVPAAPRQAGLPDLILIDGGKGQLNAACAELAKLGLSRIPILGIAKEFEELHRPGEAEPLRLSLDSGALKLLQRVRDESHRFANTFNAQLRLKKISESVLDEFPGIGEARKLALLKKFGSVQRLRTVSVEDIAEVPGFGGKMAADLKTFLLARESGESSKLKA